MGQRGRLLKLGLVSKLKWTDRDVIAVTLFLLFSATMGAIDAVSKLSGGDEGVITASVLFAALLTAHHVGKAG